VKGMPTSWAMSLAISSVRADRPSWTRDRSCSVPRPTWPTRPERRRAGPHGPIDVLGSSGMVP